MLLTRLEVLALLAIQRHSTQWGMGLSHDYPSLVGAFVRGDVESFRLNVRDIMYSSQLDLDADQLRPPNVTQSDMYYFMVDLGRTEGCLGLILKKNTL